MKSTSVEAPDDDVAVDEPEPADTGPVAFKAPDDVVAVDEPESTDTGPLDDEVVLEELKPPSGDGQVPQDRGPVVEPLKEIPERPASEVTSEWSSRAVDSMAFALSTLGSFALNTSAESKDVDEEVDWDELKMELRALKKDEPPQEESTVVATNEKKEVPLERTSNPLDDVSEGNGPMDADDTPVPKETIVPVTPKHQRHVRVITPVPGEKLAQPRAETPIQRMRQPQQRSEPMNEEIKAQKQRRWQEKKELLDQQRAREKQKLEGSSKRKKRREPTQNTGGWLGIREFVDSLAQFKCGGVSLDDLIFASDTFDEQSEFSSVAEDSTLSVDEDKDVEVDEPSHGEPQPKSSPKSVTDPRAYSPQARKSGLDALDIQDRTFVKSFIATLCTSGVPLLLHKRNRNQTFVRASDVLAKLSLGKERASGSFSAPSLHWIADDGVPIAVVDLFDMKSLERATVMDLEQYPLAMPMRSFILGLNNGTKYVFEADSEDSAIRFVHGMRWVVARLSFNLIIGNLGVSCELLDIDGDEQGGCGLYRRPSTKEEEYKWTSAMNHAANRLVNKSVAQIT